MSCVFCKIVAGEIPSRKIFEDDRVVAFHDLSAQAPTHFLVIPKRHIESLAETTAEDEPLLGYLTATAARIAAELNLTAGYRIVTNTGGQGGQTVPHLHLHVLGGRRMTWPPG
jgi:histidine triad (HIT) family protein